MMAANPNNDAAVNNSPTDTVSSLSWSPAGNFLAAGSWDKAVRVWEVAQNGATQAKLMIQHAAPVLCTAFSPDGTTVFSGSCDNTAKMWVLGQQPTQIAAHDAPIKEIFWCNDTKMLVTGSWDKTIKYWDPRAQGAQATIKLPERVYCMDVKSVLMVVGTAERRVLIYDARKPQTPFREMASPLKFQSRCVSIFPDKTGFALGSIEGRVAISHVEEKLAASKNFAFKCHRHGNQGTEVYAVNSIAFHGYGTFATAGSDGGYVFWDKDSKQRIKLFNRLPQPITASQFNPTGNIYAYAIGYDWSKGMEHWDKSKAPQIYLHPVDNAEIAPRNKTN